MATESRKNPHSAATVNRESAICLRRGRTKHKTKATFSSVSNNHSEEWRTRRQVAKCSLVVTAGCFIGNGCQGTTSRQQSILGGARNQKRLKRETPSTYIPIWQPNSDSLTKLVWIFKASLNVAMSQDCNGMRTNCKAHTCKSFDGKGRINFCWWNVCWATKSKWNLEIN